jgi:mRNA-degrading endonuclease toxin of MazEF toxin-antitoxin module
VARRPRQPRQWDIWFAVLRDGIKGEQKGPHHVLVLSSELTCSSTGVALVAPITTTGSIAPWVVRVEPHQTGLRLTSYIECHQAITLSTSGARFQTFRKRLVDEKRPEVALALGQVLRGTFPYDPGL